MLAIVRSQDISWWSNLPLNPVYRPRWTARAALGGGVSPTGCVDASLYSRFCTAGLVNLRFLLVGTSRVDHTR
jgi:hypothetical protein